MTENYERHLAVGLGLSLLLGVGFGVVWSVEPARMASAADQLTAGRVERGGERFAANCVACHGAQGEGISAPALNNRSFLDLVTDELMFSLIRSGVPGTAMPSWGQVNGGPFTDEDVRDLIAYIRSWQPTAPAEAGPAPAADPARGATIFASTCFICHGQEGHGGRAPALNDPQRLAGFDDEWFRETIAFGRPAKGMPTWGTVLSPEQIDDLVALLAAWRRGEEVAPVTEVGEHLKAVAFALSRGDSADATFHLEAALPIASPLQLEAIRSALGLVRDGQLERAAEVVAAVLQGPAPGDPAQGLTLFVANCEVCHGVGGAGGIGPTLADNTFIQSLTDEALLSFVLGGRPQSGMPSWEGRLTPDEIQNIIALLRTWQK